MATEKLVIELDAKVSQLNKDLDSVTKKLDALDGATDDADSGLKQFSTTATSVAGVIASFGAGVVTAGAALTAFITVTAKSRQELDLLSSQAKLTTDDFQSLAFATEQYGVTAEQLGDISKDIADKIGEFATAGTGTFQDFADVLGLTQEEAIETAERFSELSSDQVIGEVVRQLEEAGATANQTTFVLESLGNDLSKLTPLFADNAKELNNLRERYADVNDQLSLTSSQQQQLQGVATSFDLLTKSLGNAAAVVASSLAPQFDAFFNAVLSVVPDATDTIVDFINTFQDASDIESIDSLNRLIEDQQVKIDRLNTAITGYTSANTAYNFTEEEKSRLISEANVALDEQIARQDELKTKLEELTEAEERAAAIRREAQGSFIAGETTTNLDTEAQAQQEAQLQAIEDRFKTEEQLLAEKLARELELVGENERLKDELIAEFENNRLDLEIERTDQEIALRESKRKAAEDAAKAEAEAEKKYNDQKLSSALSYTNAAVSLGNLLFEDNKAVRAGLVVVDTAAGITRAFADLPYPAAIAASASIAASGAAQLATINSATTGGSSSATTTATTDVDTSIPETSELTVSESDASGANQQIVLKIEADDSDVANSIASLLESAQVTGTLS